MPPDDGLGAALQQADISAVAPVERAAPLERARLRRAVEAVAVGPRGGVAATRPSSSGTATPSVRRAPIRLLGVGLRGHGRGRGAPDDTPAGMDAGSAYVFVRSGTTWTEQQKLVASDGAAGDASASGVGLRGHGGGRGARRRHPGRRERARRTCSCARGRPGPSSRSSWPRTARRATRSASRCRSPGTRWWSGASRTTRRRARTRARRTCSCARGRPGPSSRSSWRSDGAASDGFGSSVSVSGDTVGGRARPWTTRRAAWMRARRTCSCARGRPGPQQQKLLASDGAAGDFFGYSVSVSGDTVVVGALADDTPGGADAGSAYVFVRSGTTWTRAAEAPGVGRQRRTTLRPRCRSPGTRWWSGRTWTTRPAGTDAGSAYVFVRSGTTWTEQQKLRGVGRRGGRRLRLLGVGLRGHGRGRGARGRRRRAARMRARPTCSCARARPGPSSRSSWPRTARASDAFGVSVSVSGDTVVVGAHGTTPRAAWTRARRTCSCARARPGPSSRSSWPRTERRTTASASRWRSPGDTVVVGAHGTTRRRARMRARRTCSCARGRPGPSSRSSWPRTERRATASASRWRSRGTRWWSGRPCDDTPGGANAGSAYVFVRSGTTWTRAAEAPGRRTERRTTSFGVSVSVSGTRRWSGRIADDTAGGADAGSAYVFVRSGTTWTPAAEAPGLGRSGGRRLRLLGLGLRGHGGGRGALRRHPGGADAGSAYVFVRSGTTWTEQQKLLASDGAASDQFGVLGVASPGTRSWSGRARTTRRAARMRARRTCSCARGRPGPSSRSSWRRTERRTTIFGYSVSVSGDTVVVGAQPATNARAARMRARHTFSGIIVDPDDLIFRDGFDPDLP